MGLREIKKNKLKQTLEREAVRLFAEQGYEKTTVEQIAAAAEISTTTFYRYYSSKEDLVLTGAHEERQGLHFVDGLPPGRPLIESLRAMLDELRASDVFVQDRDAMLARLRLIGSVPELRALQQQRTQEGLKSLGGMLAAARGADPESLEVRMAAALVGGAVAEALHYWVDHDGTPDIGLLFDRTLDLLAPVLDP